MDNPFIRASLTTALTYPACCKKIAQFFSEKGVKIVILASKYFYGYLDKIEPPYTLEKLEAIPEFSSFSGFGTKTGMGSSSALIAGLTSLLILQFK